jgi:hypothetical protein
MWVFNLIGLLTYYSCPFIDIRLIDIWYFEAFIKHIFICLYGFWSEVGAHIYDWPGVHLTPQALLRTNKEWPNNQST